jgi:hypothetical protein
VTSPASPADRLEVAPVHPDAPGVPLPPIAEDAYDADLAEATDAHSRPGRRALFVVRLATIVFAALLIASLRRDLAFAFSPAEARALGGDPSPAELDAACGRFVELHAIPGGVGAVDYRRALREGRFRLAPLVDRPDVFVELRLPEGADPARFVPPSTLRGRLVRLDDGGVRFGDVRTLIERATGRSAPATAWLLEHGAEPSLRAPAVALGGVAALVGLLQIAGLLADRRRRTG